MPYSEKARSYGGVPPDMVTEIIPVFGGPLSRWQIDGDVVTMAFSGNAGRLTGTAMTSLQI